MSRQILESEAVAFFKERDRFLIFTHNSPDADTIGSACALVIALCACGKQAYAYNSEEIPQRLSFLQPEKYFVRTLPPTDAYTLLSVDVASPAVLSEQDAAHRFALSIDHHAINSVLCERLLLHADYAAAGEIVYELIKEMGVPLTKEIATCLYAAISSDSGGFRYPSTRPETMQTAAALMQTGIDFAEINRRLFACKTPAQIAVEKLAYEKLDILFDGKFALVTVTADELAATGASDADTGSLNELPRQVNGTLASAVIKPKGSLIKCSLRSDGQVDVSRIAAKFQGGGHMCAAGFSVKNGDIDAVRQALLETMQEVLA